MSYPYVTSWRNQKIRVKSFSVGWNEMLTVPRHGERHKSRTGTLDAQFSLNLADPLSVRFKGAASVGRNARRADCAYSSRAG